MGRQGNKKVVMGMGRVREQESEREGRSQARRRGKERKDLEGDEVQERGELQRGD